MRKVACKGAAVAAVAAFCAMAPLVAVAEPTVRMEQSDDDHLWSSFRGWADPVYIPPRTRFVQPRRVYVFNDAIGKFAREDKTLSHLCQRGAFKQKIDGIYWAETPERRFGVAFSGGANLDDPQNRRQSGQVFFFERQDSRCRVYVAQQAPLMNRFTPPGSTVPMAGPTGIPYLPGTAGALAPGSANPPPGPVAPGGYATGGASNRR